MATAMVAAAATASPTGRPVVQLAVASSPAARADHLQAWLATVPAGVAAAVLIEAMPSALPALPPGLPVAWLPPGCVCCTGAVPLRVTLDRLVRAHRPARVLLLLSAGAHRARVLTRLADSGYAVDPADRGDGAPM